MAMGWHIQSGLGWNIDTTYLLNYVHMYIHTYMCTRHSPWYWVNGFESTATVVVCVL